MLEAKFWHNNTEIKNVKVEKMVEFIKTYDQYPRRFNFGNFFNSIIILRPPPPLLSAGEEIDLHKIFFARNGKFCSASEEMIKTCGRVLLGGMSKNDQIHIFDSQMYLPVMLTP